VGESRSYLTLHVPHVRVQSYVDTAILYPRVSTLLVPTPGDGRRHHSTAPTGGLPGRFVPL
jgi:hypothetical protein